MKFSITQFSMASLLSKPIFCGHFFTLWTAYQSSPIAGARWGLVPVETVQCLNDNRKGMVAVNNVFVLESSPATISDDDSVGCV